MAAIMQKPRLLGTMRHIAPAPSPQSFKCGFCSDGLLDPGQEVEAKIVQRLLSWLGDFRNKYPDVGDLPVSQHWCQMCFGLSASIMQNLFDLGERLQGRAHVVATVTAAAKAAAANVALANMHQHQSQSFNNKDNHMDDSGDEEKPFAALTNSVNPAQAFQAAAAMSNPLFPNLGSMVDPDLPPVSKKQRPIAPAMPTPGSFQMSPFISLPNQNGKPKLPKPRPTQSHIFMDTSPNFPNGVNMMGKKIKKKYYTPKKSRPEFQCMVCGQMLCSKNWLENHLKKHGITDPNDPRPAPGAAAIAAIQGMRNPPPIATNQDIKTGIITIAPIEGEPDSIGGPSGGEIHPTSVPLRNKWGKIKKKDIAVFQCPICSKQLRSQAWLDNHMKRHLNINNIECPICQRVFLDTKNFRRHYRLHMENSPYQCEVCGKKCGRPRELLKHMNSHTEDMIQDVCPKCKQTFEGQQQLMEHVEKEHPNVVPVLTRALTAPPPDDDGEDDEQQNKIDEILATEDDAFVSGDEEGDNEDYRNLHGESMGDEGGEGDNSMEMGDEGEMDMDMDHSAAEEGVEENHHMYANDGSDNEGDMSDNRENGDDGGYTIEVNDHEEDGEAGGNDDGNNDDGNNDDGHVNHAETSEEHQEVHENGDESEDPSHNEADDRNEADGQAEYQNEADGQAEYQNEADGQAEYQNEADGQAEYQNEAEGQNDSTNNESTEMNVSLNDTSESVNYANAFENIHKESNAIS